MIATRLGRAPMATTRSSLIWTGRLLAVTSLGVSPQSSQIRENIRAIALHGSLPTFNTRRTFAERFRQLANRWRAETSWLSSTTAIAMHPAYQEIIGMGEGALPHILEDLRDNSGDWYWALKSISKDDPVPPRDRGKTNRMKAAWLRWGSIKGLVAT